MTIHIEFEDNGVKTVMTVEKATSLLATDYIRLEDIGIELRS